MSTESGLRSRVDDWLNPIVVKELRQAVQGRFVSAALLLLLLIQLATLGIYIVSGGDFASRFDAGRNAFMFLLAILMAICLIFVPAYTAIRLAFERDTNVDLLFVTTIRPSAIVWGKLFAALTVTILIFSACLPFMVFTYWLRGIDLPSIFVLMGASFLVVALAVQLATFVACLPAGRVLKILLSLIVLILFLQAFIATLTWSYYSLSVGIGSRLGSWTFWGPATAVLMIIAALLGLLFALSVAMIKPASANRAMPVRLFVTAMWGVSGIASAVISYVQRDNSALSVWGILSVILFSGSFFVAVSEREELGPRVARKIPSSGLRLPAFFFFSGAASGIAWAALMSLLTSVSVKLMTASSVTLRAGGSVRESQVWMRGLALYGIAYAMTALLVRRYLLSKWIGAKFTWLIALLLLVAGCLIPFLLGYLISFNNFNRPADIGGWLITNPFALGIESYRSVYLLVSSGWALLATILNVDWFGEQIRAFKRPTAESFTGVIRK